MTDYLLEMNNIVKEFSGVRALNDVNFNVYEREIHALCGENGAGKSTLMNILSGVIPHHQYEGTIVYDGQEINYENINNSEADGIVVIHQELALIPYLSVMENIFLGHEISNKGIIDWEATELETVKLLEKVGLEASPTELIINLSVGQQQLVEIAKAISKNVKLLILDEPTAALNEDDSDNLLELIKGFQSEGITSIIISHKLNEIIEIADRVTILRDGQTVQTLEHDEITETKIIKGMVGRELTNRYPDRHPNIGETVLEVKDWTVYHPIDSHRKVNDSLNFEIKRGEIVGIAGLMGAGRTEFAMSLFGRSYGQNTSGTIIKDGQEIKLNNVSEAIDKGFAYVPEDRKDLGLILLKDIRENITAASLDKISNRTVIDLEKEIQEAQHYKEILNIKARDINQNVASLSGGNQQKVVLGKWLMSDADIIFLDEPTRGIDVGTKYEVYTIIEELANAGKGICIISSELPEVMGMSDRIYTMSEGRFTGEVTREEATQEKLMTMMTEE